jgi:hypothetical protein
MTDGSNEVKTYSEEDYNKAVTRAQRFEAQMVDLQKQVERFKGVDLDRLKAIEEDYENIKRDKAAGNPEDLKKWKVDFEGRIRSEVQSDIAKRDEELGKLRLENRELRVVDKAIDQLADRFNPDTIPFIKGLVRQHVDVDDTGEFIVKDDKGDVRYVQGQPNQKMGIRHFAEELAAKHPSFARASVPAGGKQAGQKGAPPASLDAQRYLRMTPEQQAQVPAAERQKLALEILKTRPVSSRP